MEWSLEMAWMIVDDLELVILMVMEIEKKNDNKPVVEMLIEIRR